MKPVHIIEKCACGAFFDLVAAGNEVTHVQNVLKDWRAQHSCTKRDEKEEARDTTAGQFERAETAEIGFTERARRL